MKSAYAPARTSAPERTRSQGTCRSRQQETLATSSPRRVILRSRASPRVATKPHETKAALLEGVVARVRDTVDKAEADDAERFLRSYYANVAPDDLIGRSEADLAGAALAHWG